MGDFDKNIDKFKELIENGVNLNMPNKEDEEERTVLHLAVENGHFSVVELLVKNGADLNI